MTVEQSLEPKVESFKSRALTREELSFQTASRPFPLVIESSGGETFTGLRDTVQAQRSRLEEILWEHGAIVFRGFPVSGYREYEDFIDALFPKQAITQYFMSEPGRTLIPGTRKLFDTDSRKKGLFKYYLGGAHSENFFSSDVPAYLCFWNKRVAPKGGETAVIDGQGLYTDLSPSLQKKLGEKEVLAATFPLSEVAARYGLRADEVKLHALARGLRVTEGPSGPVIQIFKPLIWEHPVTGRRSLQFNSNIFPEIDYYLRKIVASQYRGAAWFAHKLIWKALDLSSRSLRSGGESTHRPSLSRSEQEALAKLVWNHTTLVKWQLNDVLVIDNFQLLHMPMPWIGKRELRVMMAAPVQRLDEGSSGRFKRPSEGAGAETFGGFLEHISKAAQATP